MVPPVQCQTGSLRNKTFRWPSLGTTVLSGIPDEARLPGKKNSRHGKVYTRQGWGSNVIANVIHGTQRAIRARRHPAETVKGAARIDSPGGGIAYAAAR